MADDFYTVNAQGRVAAGRFLSAVNFEHLIDEFSPAIPNLETSVSMPNTIIDLGNQGGDRPELGLYTEWQARYLAIRNDPAVSQSEKDELRAYIIKQADDIKDYPWWDIDALAAINVVPDMSHRPNVFFLPILLTSNQSQREDFMYALRGMYYTQMRWRQRIGSDTSTPNVLYQIPIQERTWAWTMREIAQLAYLEEKGILTNSYLGGTEFRTAMANNLSHLQEQMQLPEMSQLGWLGSPIWRDMDGRNQRNIINWRIGHWQQGFCGQVVGHILKLGFTDWLPVANWHMNFFNAVSGGKWPLRDADGDYIYFNHLMPNTFDQLPEQDKAAYDIYVNIPLYDAVTSDRRWTSSRADALLAHDSGNGWPLDTIVNTSVGGETMTFSDRLDNRLSALGLYADTGVTGAAELLATLKEQRQLRIDRGGSGDLKQYKNSLAWRVDNLPAWRVSMEPETVIEVSSNTLVDIDPDRDAALNPNFPADAPWHGNGGITSSVSAWNGAALDIKRSRLRLFGNGGHGDYGGNEDIELDLMQEAPAFVLKRAPSGAITPEYPSGFVVDDGQESTGVYADGLPRSKHTYNKPIYDPEDDKLALVIGGSSFKTATYYVTDQRPEFFGIDGEYLGAGNNTSFAGAGASSGGGGCYDSLRDCYWFLCRGGSQRMLQYNKATDSWTRGDTTIPGRSDPAPNFSYRSLTYMPDIDKIFIATGNSLTLDADNRGWLYDPALDTVIELTITGSKVGCVLSGDLQVEYDQTRKELYYWNNSESTNVINKIVVPEVLTEPWQIQQMTFTGATVTTRTSRGTYGRFRFVPDLNGFVLLNSASQPAYFFSRGNS